jgi:hypothetical protein
MGPLVEQSKPTVVWSAGWVHNPASALAAELAEEGDAIEVGFYDQSGADNEHYEAPLAGVVELIFMIPNLAKNPAALQLLVP